METCMATNVRARATPASAARAMRARPRDVVRPRTEVRVAAAEGGAQEAAQEKKAAPEAAPKAAAPAAAPKPAPKKKAPATAFKSGDIVRVVKEKYVGSLEALANQSTNYTGLDYIFENRGEVLEVKVFKAGEYALVSARRAMRANDSTVHGWGDGCGTAAPHLDTRRSKGQNTDHALSPYVICADERKCFF
eukprot:scaffold287_cov337-Pavlova_lutheri.AAC.260